MPDRGEFCVQGCLGGNSGNLCWCTVRPAELRAAETARPVQFRCATGLEMILTPVVVRGRYLGGVLAGPFAVRRLDARASRRLRRELAARGLTPGSEELRNVWRHSPTVGRKKRRAVAEMMVLFAQYLSARAERQLAAEAEPMAPLVRKVEALLGAEGAGEAASLREVAARLSLSPCHFCRVFKRQTGLTLTEYRTQRRLELAKRLLLQPERRVSEIAFEVGFESIPHFNRVFRRYVGCSPTQYRRGNCAQIQVK